MLLSFAKVKVVFGLLLLALTLGGAPREAPQSTLRIRVSQESSPGAGDFDDHVLGFIEALNTDGNAASFYRYKKPTITDWGGRYGNTAPVLTPQTAHIFFVNGSDGVALYVVYGTPNRLEESGRGGKVEARYELSGGTASILQSDDENETASESGTVFTNRMAWPASNTDGIVIGTLPIGFTILGQFTVPPEGLDAGWRAISADGMSYPLQLVPGRRVRLDVKLVTDMPQGQP